MQSTSTSNNILNILFILSGTLKGLQKLWVIGDEFADRSFTEHTKHARTSNKEPYYTLNNFEVCDFTTTRYSSSFTNILARVRGLVTHAILKEKYLPRAFLLVLDDDIIRQSNIHSGERYSVEQQFTVLIDYLHRELHRLIENCKDTLPVKAKLEFFPHFIWITPPTHRGFTNNEEREIFAGVLDVQTSKYNSMCCLSFRKVWDHEEAAFYQFQQCRFSPEGLHAYWLSIDASIKFWNKTLSDILVKKQRKAFFSKNNLGYVQVQSYIGPNRERL